MTKQEKNRFDEIDENNSNRFESKSRTVLPRWKDSDDDIPSKVEETTVKLVIDDSQRSLVEEFLPLNREEKLLEVLRELFIRSFDQFYREIEERLRLTQGTTLEKWLNETFDTIANDLLERTCRCFILRRNDDDDKEVVGFLTLKEEENNSVYIGQCAIKPEAKRRGYGTHLLQHLRNVYPIGTTYRGLCRRANTPAIHFYLKQGAKLMDDDEIALKYQYDSTLYTGFQFVDKGQNLPNSTVPAKSNIFRSRSANRICEEKAVMTEPIFNSKRRKKRLFFMKWCCART